MHEVTPRVTVSYFAHAMSPNCAAQLCSLQSLATFSYRELARLGYQVVIYLFWGNPSVNTLQTETWNVINAATG